MHTEYERCCTPACETGYPSVPRLRIQFRREHLRVNAKQSLMLQKKTYLKCRMLGNTGFVAPNVFYQVLVEFNLCTGYDSFKLTFVLSARVSIARLETEVHIAIPGMPQLYYMNPGMQ